MTKQLGNLEQPLAEPSKATNCCWSKILSLQSDFVSERPLLQMVIEEAGHICLFLPKFHCELNPIELFGCISRTVSFVLIIYLRYQANTFLAICTVYWRRSHKFSTWKEYQALFEQDHIACPLSTIRKYFQHVDRQHSAYKLGLDAHAAQRVMKKYKSHWQIPKSALMDIDVITNQ